MKNAWVIDVTLEGLLFVLELSKSIKVALFFPTITCFEILLNSPWSNSIWSSLKQSSKIFFIGSGIAKQVQKIYKNSPKEKIILALKNYKQEKTRENFEKLLKILKL